MSRTAGGGVSGWDAGGVASVRIGDDDRGGHDVGGDQDDLGDGVGVGSERGDDEPTVSATAVQANVARGRGAQRPRAAA